MQIRNSRRFRPSGWPIAAAILLFAGGGALAEDVTRPARVTGLTGERGANDTVLTWPAVLLDAAGNAETIASYRVYRGTTPDFVPDRTGGTNLIGTTATAQFTDVGAVAAPLDYYYRIGAVDAAGNESDSNDPRVATPPVVSGFWTAQSVEIDWTDATPIDEVVAYRVYWGRGPRQYEGSTDVGLNTSFTLTAVQKDTNWYLAVTALDAEGNQSPFSNEHIDAINGTVKFRVHDGDELCWGAAGCTPSDPTKLQRRDGWQLLVPTYFPEGDWVSAKVTYTIESRLCTPPAQGTLTKCGFGNPCVDPPCNGGYNPCGDPWDRTAHLFVVLDDCVETGGSCMTSDNLELIRAVTPFGTDANPPDGTGAIKARKLVYDITPFAPLLHGPMYVGADILHYVQKGWWVTVDFTFTEQPGQASPKPPADGIAIVGFGGAPLAPRQVTIPPTATQVMGRLFTTGHGGGPPYYCDGGSNNAGVCTGGADCPGGTCSNCDEFCHRPNRIKLDGTPIWEFEPWRTDCNASPGCSTWNACGFPSCTYPRAGWCPGYIACHHNAPCDNDLDLTGSIPAGGTYAIDYDVPVANGSWAVSLVVYWYE